MTLLAIAGGGVLGLVSGLALEGSSKRRTAGACVATAVVAASLAVPWAPAGSLAFASSCWAFFFVGSRVRVVGITGGMACGKSAVTAILRSEGLVVVDADEVAREVVRPGAWGYRRLLARFGTEILHADGAINRELLRTITIGENGSTQKRRQLNDATHLPIAARILTLLFYHAVVRGNPRVFLDAPLLYETGMHRLCRCVWVVTCSPEVQTARIMARDSVSKEEAEAAVATQWPLQRKVDLADAVIDNNGQRSLLQPAVLTLLQRLS